MKELIERIECAGGPSRELDAEIAAAVNGGKVDACPGRYWMPGVRGWSIAERYTASLDAAMTLVPEGRQVEVLLDAINNDTHEIDWLKHLPRYVVVGALCARNGG